jgi:hypothetical protein
VVIQHIFKAGCREIEELGIMRWNDQKIGVNKKEDVKRRGGYDDVNFNKVQREVLQIHSPYKPDKKA